MTDFFEGKRIAFMALLVLGLMVSGSYIMASTPLSVADTLKQVLEKRGATVLHDVTVTVEEIYVEGVVVNIICRVDGIRAEDLNPEMNDMLGIIFKESEARIGFIVYVYFYMIHSADDERGSMLYGVVRAITGTGKFIDGEQARLFLIQSKPQSK